MPISTAFKSNSIFVLAAAAGMLFAASQTAAQSRTPAPYEEPPILSASKILPPMLLKSEYHRVSEKVLNNGYLNQYAIHSNFGGFTAGSTAMLVKRVHEIAAIAELKKITRSQAFADAAKKAGINIVTAPIRAVEKAADTVSDPKKLGQTIASIPGGVVSLFSYAASQVESGASYVYQSGKDVVSGESSASGTPAVGIDDAADLAGRLVGADKATREWYRKLGLDPYTDNQVLQDEIRRIVQVESAVKIGFHFVPGLGLLSEVSTFNQYVKRAEQMAAFEDPTKLAGKHRSSLEAMGVGEKQIDAVMDNQAYTPTIRALLIDGLEQLKTVKDRPEYVEMANRAETQETAMFFASAAQELAEVQASGEALAEIADGIRLPAAVTEKKRLIVVLPVDHLVWTRYVAAIAGQAIERTRSSYQLTGIEMRIGGTTSDRCRSELQARGVSLVESAAATGAGS